MSNFSISMRQEIQPLLRKVRARDAVSPDEEAVLAGLIARVVSVPADTVMISEGSLTQTSNLLVTGWAARLNLLGSGRRQITELHIGGDFIDLHGFTLKRLDHDIVTLTPCRFALVPHEALVALTEQHPHLVRLLWLMTMIDASIHRRWLTVQGRMTALERVSHLLCEMFIRLELAGLTEDQYFPLPLTQEEIGDACGLTPVYVNRMAQQLRRDRLVEWRRSGVTILDWDGLRAAASFDPLYLNLETIPR